LNGYPASKHGLHKKCILNISFLARGSLSTGKDLAFCKVSFQLPSHV
jgi:hypothetical protein